MQKIIPFLWFNNNAKEAISFYTSLFKNSKILSETQYDEASSEVSGMPKDSIMTITFELEGQKFVSLNGGPIYKVTPAISFFVNADTQEEIEHLYTNLVEGGIILMGLNEYPFSKKYAWIQDKYGLSWQLNLGSKEQKIIPSLLFVGDQYNKAKEAMNFYTTLFDHSKIITSVPYEAHENEAEGAIKYGLFRLNGQEFIAMDSGYDHKFKFTSAISFIVNCETQDEIDLLWQKFTKEGKEIQCGWLEDKYHVSWQIVPTILDELLNDPDKEKSKRVMKVMLKMVKLDIKKLKEAYDQE